MNYKELRKKIRERISSVIDAISILNIFGIDVTRNKKFRIRQEEKTPSCVINTDGSFHDYGTGIHYCDIVSLLFDGYHSFDTLQDTIRFVCEHLNIYIDNETNNIRSNINESFPRINNTISHGYTQTQIEKTSHEQLNKEFDSFVAIDMNNQIHRKEMMLMFPFWLIEEARSEDIELFLQISRYDTYYQTFVVGVFEKRKSELALISYKRRRLYDIKWHTRKGTHPNNVPFIRILEEKSPLFFVEGHHDMLTAILLGISFIMVPSAGFKLAKYPSLESEIKNKDIIFLVEDKQAYKCMCTLAKTFSRSAKSIRLKTLGNGILKLDLSDYTEQHQNIMEVKDGLQD